MRRGISSPAHKMFAPSAVGVFMGVLMIVVLVLSPLIWALERILDGLIFLDTKRKKSRQGQAFDEEVYYMKRNWPRM